jgi:hypothetical protein
MPTKTRKLYPVKNHVLLLACLFLILDLAGCEAMGRKFTRKHKATEEKTEEMVLEPQEYKGDERSKEEIYREYLLFWESWHDELIEALSSTSFNHKREVDALQEAIKNLMAIRDLLKPEKQKLLDTYISQLLALDAAVSQDLYNTNLANNRQKAERIKRVIFKDFAYQKIKDHLR